MNLIPFNPSSIQLLKPRGPGLTTTIDEGLRRQARPTVPPQALSNKRRRYWRHFHRQCRMVFGRAYLVEDGVARAIDIFDFIDDGTLAVQMFEVRP